MKNPNLHTKKELVNYKTLAKPFQRRLYRTALILTKSNNLAQKVVDETNQRAEKQYYLLKTNSNFDFEAWIFLILKKIFSHQ